MTTQFTLGLAMVGAMVPAMAHEGHGLSGPHWHPSDVFGLIVCLAAVTGVLLWRARK